MTHGRSNPLSPAEQALQFGQAAVAAMESARGQDKVDVEEALEHFRAGVRALHAKIPPIDGQQFIAPVRRPTDE